MGAIELYNEQVKQIVKIDSLFDSLEDSVSAGKRKVTNELISAVTDKVEPVAAGMIQQFEAQPEEIRYALFLGFMRSLNKRFEKEADAYVTSKVPAPTEQTEKPDITDEQKKTLVENRKELLDRAKVLGAMAVDLGEMTQLDFENSLPKRRNLSGPRGKRAISFYKLTVGDTEYETMAEVAKANGYEKAAELTKAIRETGDKVNLTNPPKEFSFTLKNGNVLHAVDTRSDSERATEAETPDSDDDNGEDDDED